jgi:hypothetical protein
MTTHGKTGTPTYKSWMKMKERCSNPNAMQWKWYGGVGIKVCDRWMNSFEAFLADMGERPSLDHSIDRYPDQNGNYEPENCRWATRQEQIDNQKKTIWVVIDGKRRTLRSVCKDRGLNFLRVYGRLQAGHELETALEPNDRRFKTRVA